MDRLAVSFSGGKTSAYLGRWVQQNWQDRYNDIIYLFANTGCEHEKTLEFVQRCDDEWKLGVVWVEAVVNPIKGKGIRHKIVTFDTAARNGEPFEAQIAKEGIPNQANRKCSDRLKLAAMMSYRRSIGWKTGHYDTAIGIRIDEVDRCHSRFKELRLVYPLVSDVPMTKQHIHNWWKEQSFELGIPEHWGNCVFCPFKSDRKLLTLLDEIPEAFEFPARMEEAYGHVKSTDEIYTNGTRKRFFRNNRTVADLIKIAEKGFEPFVDTNDGVYTPDMFNDPLLDQTNGCSESCDIYAD